MAGATISTAYVQLIPSMEGAQRNITESLVPGATAAGNQAGTAAGGGLAAGMSKFLTPAVVAGAVAAVGVGLFKVGETFDDITDTIRVGTGTSGVALDGLVDVAKRVGSQVPVQFDKVGPVIADLNTRLGLSGEALETVASQYLEAGRILGQDVDISRTTAAFSAFGIEGDAVSGAMDDLFRASQATGVGMNELAASAQGAAPALQGLGFSFGDSIALIGQFDKAGLNSSQVMSGMSRALVNLAKDGEQPQEAFKRVVSEIGGFIAAGDEAAALDLASQVFGTRGAPQFLEAVRSGALSVEDLTASIGASGDTILGVSAETADFAESWQLLKNNAALALEPLGSAVFSGLSSALASIVPYAQQFAEWMQNLSFDGLGGALGFLDPIRGAFEAIWPTIQGLIPQVLELVSAFSPMRIVVEALTPIMDVLAGILVQVVEAIVPLILMIGAELVYALEVISPLFSMLAGVVVQLLEALLPLVPILAELASALFGALAGVLIQLIQAALPVVEVILGLAAEIFPMLAEVIGVVLQAVMALLPVIFTLVDPFMALVTALLPIVGLIAELIGALLPPLLDLFMALIVPIVGLVGVLVEALAPILELVAGLLTTVLVPILSALITVVAEVIGWVINLAGPILGALVSVLSGVVGAITSAVQWLGNFFSSLGNVGGAVSGVATALGEGFSRAWQSVSDFVGRIVTAVTEIPGKIGQAFANLANLLFNAGKNIITGLINGITSMINKVRETVGSIAQTIRNFLPFSPAKEGPLSGSGSPDRAGQKISGMVAEGILAGQSEVDAAMDQVLSHAPDVSVGLAGAGAYSALAPAAQSAPTVLEVRDVDGALIGRMQTEAGRVQSRRVSPLSVGVPSWG